MKIKYAVIYCRVSSSQQSKYGESLAVQEEECRKYCERKWYTVLRVFKEQITGTAEDRPQVEEALNFVRNSEVPIEYVIALKIDRISRWGIEILNDFKKSFKELWVTLEDTYGVIWESKNVVEIEWIDTDCYEWAQENNREHAESITAIVAKEERINAVRRMLAQEIKNNQRWYASRNSHYWFTNEEIRTDGWKKKIQVENTEESIYIKKMYELRARWGMSDMQIVDELNNMWYRSRTSSKWNKDKTQIIGTIWGRKLSTEQLRRFIQRPVYAWILCEKWTGNKPIKTPYDWLVSIAMWNKANRWLKRILKQWKEYRIVYQQNWEEVETRIIQKPKNYNPEFPYGKMLQCPECGWHLTAEKSKSSTWKHHFYYSCRGKKWAKHKNYYLKRDEVNEKILKYFSEVQFDDSAFEIFDKISEEVFKERSKEYKDLQQSNKEKIEELTTKGEHIFSYIDSLTDSPLLFEAKKKEFENIQKEIKELKEDKKYSTESIWIKRFQQHAKKSLKLTKYLASQKENPEIIQMVFDIVFGGKIEYEKMQSRTPINHYFSALTNKKEFQLNWNSSLNRKWWVIRGSNSGPSP